MRMGKLLEAVARVPEMGATGKFWLNRIVLV
jgi:hypothetical protein